MGAGVAVALVTDGSTRWPLYATDPLAALLDERQHVLGEGPAIDAHRYRRPVLVPDVRAGDTTATWPAFAQEIYDQRIGAVFAFPLTAGDALLGTVQLHRPASGALTAREEAKLPGLLGSLLSAVLDDFTDDPDIVLDAWARDTDQSAIAVATGMVAEQLHTTIDNAMARLRATAYADNRPLADVARDVINGSYTYLQP